MELISLQQAREKGLARYFTGQPCKHGHVAERRVVGRCCITCADKTARSWAKQNQERVKEISAEWNFRNKDKEAARARQWRKANPDKYKLAVSKWRKDNAAYYRGYMTQIAMKRRVAKIQREPIWNDAERTKAYYDVCAFFNEVNGYTKYHVDHIIPLRGKRVSGLHVHNNLQVILASENKAKGNRFKV